MEWLVFPAIGLAVVVIVAVVRSRSRSAPEPPPLAAWPELSRSTPRPAPRPAAPQASPPPGDRIIAITMTATHDDGRVEELPSGTINLDAIEREVAADLRRREAWRREPRDPNAPEPTFGGRPLSGWIAELGQRSSQRRIAAIGALRSIGLPAEPALPHLWTLGRHRNREVAESALGAIMEIASDREEMIRARELMEQRFY